MLDKLKSIHENYLQIGEKLSDPDIISNQAEFQKLAKQHASLTEIVEKYQEYAQVLQGLEDTKELLEAETDPTMQEMIQEEEKELQIEKEALEAQINLLLLPKDPNDDKNVIMEIRGGAGGDEANLFAGDLFRMYARYAENNNWKIDILNSHVSEVGGYKEVVFSVEGQGAYSKLKFESGVHRVQRIPTTESGGRIHTSTVTVAVLAEAEDVDVDLDLNDVRVDIFCSSGPGGQSVNTTQSAVRVTHEPTGIVVSCQDEKSQHKNKAQALKVLRARLLERAQEEAHGEEAEKRKSQVGTGDRSERIRTYNYPQNRVTDHRINLSLHKLANMLEGDLDEMIETLITTDQAERLKNV